MHAQVIHDQEQFLRRPRDQMRQEDNEQRGVHLPGVDHPPLLSLIRNGCDHVRAEPISRHDQLRGLARVGIAATMLADRTHPRLILPMDLPTLLRRSLLDLRIRLFQPFGHRLGILLVRLPQGFLGREASASQILADGANRQSKADLLLDQLLNGLTRPQRRSVLQMVRTLGLDQLLNGLLLLAGQ
jgi:hypothetical protein